MLSNHFLVDRSLQLLIHSTYVKKSSLPIQRKQNAAKLIHRETLLNKKIIFGTFLNRSTFVPSILRVVRCRMMKASKVQGIWRITSIDSLVHVLRKTFEIKITKIVHYIGWTFKSRKFVPAYRCTFLPYPSSKSEFCSTSTSPITHHMTYTPRIITPYLFMVARTGCLIFHGFSARGLLYCHNKILRHSTRARKLFGTLWPALPGRPGGPGSEQNIFH